MQIPQMYVFLAGELLIAFVGVSAFLFFMLLKSYRDSRGMLDRAKQRIGELKEFESRHEQVQENLRKFMKGFAHLKKQLAAAETELAAASEYPQKIEELQQALSELRERAARVESLEQEIQRLREPDDGQAGELLIDVEPVGGREVTDDVQRETVDYPVHERAEPGDAKQEEIDKLRNANNNKLRTIQELRESLLKDSEEGRDEANQQLGRLEHMLQESETCVTLLEDELASLQGRVHEYEEQLQALGGDAGEAQVSTAEVEQLQGQFDSVNEMVITMMKANGDQSNLINFSRRATTCDSFEELGDAVLDTLDNFGLSGSIQIRCNEGVFNRSHHGHVKPADLPKLSDMDSEERFEADGDELLIRFDKVSMLIDAMPVDDSDQYARFKDSLAITMELAVAEVGNLEKAYDQEKQHAMLKKVIASTRRTMQGVETQFQDQANESKQIMDSLSFVMENEEFTREMQPAFQKVFRDVMSESKQRFDELHARGVEVDESFMEVISTLGQSAD